MAATVKGPDLTKEQWGILLEETGGLVTQTLSMTNRADKKIARGLVGDHAAIAWYSKTTEVSIEAYGETDYDAGQALTLANTKLLTPASTAYFVEEITVTRQFDDFIKTSIKAMAYSGVTNTA